MLNCCRHSFISHRLFCVSDGGVFVSKILSLPKIRSARSNDRHGAIIAVPFLSWHPERQARHDDDAIAGARKAFGKGGPARAFDVLILGVFADDAMHAPDESQSQPSSHDCSARQSFMLTESADTFSYGRLSLLQRFYASCGDAGLRRRLMTELQLGHSPASSAMPRLKSTCGRQFSSRRRRDELAVMWRTSPRR